MEQVSSLTRLVRDGGIESTLPLQTIKPVKAERLKITKIRRKIMQIKIQDDAWKRKIRNRVNTNTISEDISGDYLTIKKTCGSRRMNRRRRLTNRILHKKNKL